MKRRKVIGLVGVEALVCPVVARAQQSERVRRISDDRDLVGQVFPYEIFNRITSSLGEDLRNY